MLMTLLLAVLERHAEIALASIAQHRHDDLVRRQRLGDAAGSPHVGAGRDTNEQALLSRQPTGRRGGVLVAHQDDLVEHGAVEHPRHEGRADALDAVGPRPPAREHRRARRLDTDYADTGHALLEHLAHAGDGAAGPHAGDERVYTLLGRVENLERCRPPVRLWIGAV